MHASYAFLLEDVTFDPTISVEDIKADALCHFEHWAETNCDENNWWEPEVLIFKTGEAIQMADEGDARGRDTTYEYFARRLPHRRWAYAIAAARSFVNYELDQLGCKPIRRAKTGHAVLNDRLRSITVTPEPKGGGELWLKWYHAKKFIATVPFVLETLRNETFPFSDDGTPYDFRAFTLCNEGIDNATAILIVDIHT